jgi:ParB-like chromosome segregation protein Spo0J
MPAKKKATKTKGQLPLGWTNHKVAVGDLIEWDKNPRKLTSKQADDLRDSMKKFDYVEPIILDFDKKSIIGGHQRRRVMLQRLTLDPDTKIDVRIPNRPLTPAEKEELAIRLNKNQGEWDYDILANQFEVTDLFEWGFEPKEFSMEDSTAPSAGGASVDPDVCPKCKRPL